MLAEPIRATGERGEYRLKRGGLERREEKLAVAQIHRAAGDSRHPFWSAVDSAATFASDPVRVFLIEEDDDYLLTRDPLAGIRDAEFLLDYRLGERDGRGLLLGSRVASRTRSLRVGNARFRQVTGWVPRYPNAGAGWLATIAASGRP